MTSMNSDVKVKLENDIMAQFPDFAKRIGLTKYTYSKENDVSDLFIMKDTDKSYLYTPKYLLSGGMADIESIDHIDIKLAAILFQDDALEVHNMDLEFHNSNDPLLKELVYLHKLSNYLSLFEEMKSFILDRSDIVIKVVPTLKFNFAGELEEIGISFKYFDSYQSNIKNRSYYTNSVCLYNIHFNKSYKINTPEESLIFSKMAFLSIDDEKLMEVFECDDWIELYDKFKSNPEGCLSLYDMTKI